eukprot:TRINITY_DN660_c0_g1_i2.p1 TRINITY_DN660_c0_g1~~TRINITY_DN660_c0_g1_i2.p1  ORF type:complete len:634 (-),score=136.49 TRINITY_DN660_c0_g1_i2:120-2021(-)
MEEPSQQLFVSGLPDSTSEQELAGRFQHFGPLSNVTVVADTPGQTYAIVIYEQEEHAANAKHYLNNRLRMPGAITPAEVIFARHQAGQGKGQPGAMYLDTESASAEGARITLTGLPADVSEDDVRDGFCQYGVIWEVAIEAAADGRTNNAHVIFEQQQEANLAASVEGIYVAGRWVDCKVMLPTTHAAKKQRKKAAAAAAPAAAPAAQQAAPAVQAQADTGNTSGSTKLMINSLPDDISEILLRAEFSRYGQILEVRLKTDNPPGRQYAFITLGTPEQASSAKDATHQVLMFPGARAPCQVKFMVPSRGSKAGAGDAAAATPTTAVTRNAPVPTAARAAPVAPQAPAVPKAQARPSKAAAAAVATKGHGRSQLAAPVEPPEKSEQGVEEEDDPFESESPAVSVPPAAPPAPPPAPKRPNQPGAPPPVPEARLTWKGYYTTAGIPYYHNHATGESQWEHPAGMPRVDIEPAPSQEELHAYLLEAAQEAANKEAYENGKGYGKGQGDYDQRSNDWGQNKRKGRHDDSHEDWSHWRYQKQARGYASQYAIKQEEPDDDPFGFYQPTALASVAPEDGGSPQEQEDQSWDKYGKDQGWKKQGGWSNWQDQGKKQGWRDRDWKQDSRWSSEVKEEVWEQ